MIPKSKKISENEEISQPTVVVPESNYADYNFKPLQIKHESRDATTESMLTIVNTSSNGKRMVFASELIESIGSPSAIQVATNDEGIAISIGHQDSGSSLVLRRIGKKPCVYSSQLVDEITSIFGLDFSNKTSISFYEALYLDNDGTPVAFVTLKHNDAEEENNGNSAFADSSDASFEEAAGLTEAQVLEAESDTEEELDHSPESLEE